MPIRQAGGELCARKDTVQLALLEAAGARASDSPLPTTKPLGIPRGFSLGSELTNPDFGIQDFAHELLVRSMSLQPVINGGDIRAAYEQMTLDQPRVFSIYGEEIAGPFDSHKMFEKHWHSQSDPRSIPRRILSRIAISNVTGCWIPDYYLNHAGYAGATDRELDMNPSGSAGLHRVTRARQELYDADMPLLTPEHDVDHTCRHTSCCCPGHTTRMSSEENNLRKDTAVPLEAALASGQLALIGANGWSYAPVAAMLEGHQVIIASRFGAFELSQLDKDTLLVTLVNCVAREKERRLGKKPTKRYEKPKVNSEQDYFGFI